jgi:hypothetical protein
MVEPDDLTHPVNRLSFVHMSEEFTGGGGTLAVEGSGTKNQPISSLQYTNREA